MTNRKQMKMYRQFIHKFGLEFTALLKLQANQHTLLHLLIILAVCCKLAYNYMIYRYYSADKNETKERGTITSKNNNQRKNDRKMVRFRSKKSHDFHCNWHQRMFCLSMHRFVVAASNIQMHVHFMPSLCIGMPFRPRVDAQQQRCRWPWQNDTPYSSRSLALSNTLCSASNTSNCSYKLYTCLSPSIAAIWTSIIFNFFYVFLIRAQRRRTYEQKTVDSLPHSKMNYHWNARSEHIYCMRYVQQNYIKQIIITIIIITIINNNKALKNWRTHIRA